MSETNQQTLGKYRIIKEIGRGGFSVVYHAVDTSAKDRSVALKVLHPQLLIDPTFVQRFHQEAGVAANLTHPHIVTIYEVSEVEGSHFIAMEFVDGPSLDAVVSREGPLPLERLVKIVRQIASALDYAHGEGLVHRDVKSSNIILGPGDHAVLTDFGLVKAGEGTVLTSMGQILGTPEYMSPEQAEAKEIDWRSDLYSLGVVVYEMCTGRVPFKGPTPSSVHYQHVNKEPPRPSELNPGLAGPVEEILLKGLAKQPEDRFQKAQDLADELADVAKELEESRLASLYAEAAELFDSGEFQQAASKFEELLKRRPEYRDAAARLEACRQREQIPIWADEARTLVDQARERLQMIRQADPSYEDPDGVLMALERIAVTRGLWMECIEAVREYQWQAAAKTVQEIQRADPASIQAEALAVVLQRALKHDRETVQRRQRSVGTHKRAVVTSEQSRDEEDEKDRRESWGEKWRPDPVDVAGWALIFIWAGLALIADNLGLIRFGTRLGTWGPIFAGAGVIVLVQVLIRLLVPAYRRLILGNFVFAWILLGIGLGDIVGRSLIWATGLIIIGAVSLLRALLRSGN